MKELGFETIFECIPFSLEKVRLELPQIDREADYFRLDAPDWVNIIAFDENDQLILIEQPRVGPMQCILETPGGCVDATDDSAEVCALRELEEETGYTASSITHLGSVNPNPAIMKNQLHIFYAEGCRLNENRSHFPDHDESITVRLLPRLQARDYLLEGRINHALSAYSLALYLLKTMS